MEIIVLLKQVPATETSVNIAADGKRINPDGVKWVMNPYDEFAVEEALQLRQKHGGTVTILSMGTNKSVEAIRTGLAMGADKGILINDPAAADCDGLGTARILAAALKTMSYDVVIAGQRAMDDDNYLVGPAVAELLGIPHISMVIEETVENGMIRCRRTIEGGTVVLEAPLPVLFTTQRGLNEPRYASLPGIMKAKKKPVETKTLADLGMSGEDIAPMVEILGMRMPPERSGGRMIDGASAAEKAEKLVNLLHENARVI
ncbi:MULTISPECIES: electron transfer flavoprotein subunit beta/FixA family protein [Desulfococcus]|uniref:Electron transfer flavoprotein subunit beta n=1 Tax=Desulfococcus multivorans DSM 2059 TaxID=1121405 RepID=S7VBR3_DESML|nr:electron transfer flavoprotein subunit beta/FixA family protein [Desulfococcus multivorans]AOY56895.1 EtfB2: electron transfer flavoprotein, subunit beta [Desulfococcus multivorans]AQU99429.1 electron transfer flavoprotein subunit beta [Desulfococcus multivorans]EPR41913.1 Electron transfer flavoprotein alpha/beta-subunit [Desulfococcus multivorans DSM 2059]MDX9819960.1 electron transfer flavoprotein subunit beta/FixA family protein [Desulfococcus multivorans]SJZ94498.1 electron transfer fl